MTPPSTPKLPTIARIIAAEVDASGMTHDALAFRLGMSRQSLSNRLRGVVRWQVDELPTVADVLGLAVGDLYRQAGL